VKQILLHIGRHKTGTSSLQKFFIDNRNKLNVYGIYYPFSCVRAYAHHLLAESIAPRKIKTADIDVLSLSTVQKVRSEMESVSYNKILISSEAFQNVAPQNVFRIFEGYDVRVIVYLREQIGYFISSYNQRIHATSEFIGDEEYFQSSFSKLADYEKFLENWEKYFSGNVSVSLYDKSELIKGCIINDFFSRHLHIDVEADDSFVRGRDENPSLSAEILMFKLRLNDFLPDDYPQKSDVYKFLADLSEETVGKKFVTTQKNIFDIKTFYADSNKRVASRYLYNENAIKFDSTPLERLEQTHPPNPISLYDFVRYSKRLLERFPELANVNEHKSIARLNQFHAEFTGKEAECNRINEELNRTQAELTSVKNEIKAIFQSSSWKTIVFLRNLFIAFPGGKFLLKILKILIGKIR